MKNPMFWVVLAAVIVLGIAGIVFLAGAVEERHIETDARAMSLVSGITCLLLSIGLLVLGVFAFRRRE